MSDNVERPAVHPESEAGTARNLDGIAGSGRQGERKSILILETSRLSTMRKVIRKEVGKQGEEEFSLTILCNESRERFYGKLSGVEKIISYPARGMGAKAGAAVKLLLKLKKFDKSIAVLDRERQFRKAKLLFWLLRSREKTAYDGRMRSAPVSLGGIPGLFRRNRKANRKTRGIEVLIFETDEIEILREVIKKTHQDNVIPGARVTVFCRASTAVLLSGNPLVRRTISYSDYSFASWIVTAGKTVLSPQNVIAGVLNGRKRFPLSKMVFCLCRNRHRLVFNGSLDCCFWNRHTYGQIIVQGLKAGVNSPFAENPRKVLVLETAAPETMHKMIRIAAEPKVNPDARITVFCNETRSEEFASSASAVKEIRTYSNDSLTKKLGAAIRVIYSYPEVAVARFSGKREFQAMKLLFWLVRARHRIVFNESLDCFYLNRKTAGLMMKGRNRSFGISLLALLFRKTVRALLFFPRFAYLLAWREYRKVLHKAA